MSYARDYTLREGADRRPAPVRAAASPEPAAPAHAYPDTRTQRLSAEEVRRLGMVSALAFDKYREELEAEGDTLQAVCRAAGVTMKAAQDEWRHSQVKLATAGRAAGLRALMRADFLSVQGHFLNLAGLTVAAFNAFLKTGPTPAGEPRENVTQSVQAVRGILRKLEEFFAGQVRARGEVPAAQVREEAAARLAVYIESVEAGKCAGQRWETLPESKQQWQLYWTLKNRLAALQGTGRPEQRNKSQRAAAGKKEKAPAASERGTLTDCLF